MLYYILIWVIFIGFQCTDNNPQFLMIFYKDDNILEPVLRLIFRLIRIESELYKFNQHIV